MCLVFVFIQNTWRKGRMETKRKQVQVYMNTKEIESVSAIQRKLHLEGKERSVSMIVRELFLAGLKKEELG